MEPEAPALVVVLGPTAVGKSRVAVDLALRFGGEIISGDSIQVYRGFDIGTDKPSSAEQARRPAPSHRYRRSDGPVHRGRFRPGGPGRRPGYLLPRPAAHRRRGTGLYLKALVDGLFPGPGRDPAVRAALEAEAREKGLDALFRRLEEVDPAYAAKIRDRDRVRIVRALEVHAATGRPISEHFLATASPVAGRNVVRIGLRLERAVLVRRIEDRVDRMFARGLVERGPGLSSRRASPRTPRPSGPWATATSWRISGAGSPSTRPWP